MGEYVFPIPDRKGAQFHPQLALFVILNFRSLGRMALYISGSSIIAGVPKTYYVYLLTNFNNTTFYIGITNDLIRRIWEHKNETVKGFTKQYKLKKLVYFEEFQNALEAISREKQLKNWHRQWKINLISSNNPNYEDLYEKILK